MYLENHYSIGISWILAAPPEENLQRLQHASRPWIARIPNQIEEPHIQLGYFVHSSSNRFENLKTAPFGEIRIAPIP